MQELDSTTYFSGIDHHRTGTLVTVFDGNQSPRTIDLASFGKDYIYFGRDRACDIILSSPLVSSVHGRFTLSGESWIIEDRIAYSEKRSTNGIIFNNTLITSRTVSDGDIFRIDDSVETVRDGVLFIFSSQDSKNKWLSLSLAGKERITVGRDAVCDICLPHVTVSKAHAVITKEADGFYISDSASTNGVTVNSKKVSGSVKLHEKDVIRITSSKLIFTSAEIFYCCFTGGIRVDCDDVVIKRGRGRKSFVTCNGVSLAVSPGELVAVIGGSGAGKSTILNAMCGYLEPYSGDVYINGVDLYQSFDSLKSLIGYVPQSDIVYDNLTLHDMLAYTAKLRLPPDTLKKEREAAIDRAIATVELTEKKNSLIRSLSGGQRKRASIAVELLSDPNLLFLDEPASGLDPGTERSLMQSLRKMADGGKTVILVTHSTLQLQMCDKIVFMGKGGNLCFYGSYDSALRFFGVDSIVDIYNMITDEPEKWKKRFEATRGKSCKVKAREGSNAKITKNRLRCLSVLSARYLKLVVNDGQRLLLLLLQAPLLALLISLVANGKQFEQYEMTKSLLFALSCSAFWVGMLNSIQEICKERNILRREFMTGLSLTAYVSSKILVLGILCLVQSLSVTAVFAYLVGLPEEGIIAAPFVELFTVTFMTAAASAAMGLFVSSLFTNADRAMTVAPILLMPQILFSGLIFKLGGATEVISIFAVCRWSMEGYGTAANLNDLPLKLQTQGINIPHEAESFFEYTPAHFFASIGVLIAFTALFLFLARLVLSKLGKDRS